MVYNHFLITRFNLKKTDWAQDKNQQEVLDEEWLKRRIQLFRDFCLPSVLNQTSKAFRWLIFFEESKKERLRVLLKEIRNEDFIEPIFLNGYEEFQKKLPTLLKDRINFNPEFILTTRLDNDDAIHENFIEEIQDHVTVGEGNTILYFPYGLCLKLEGKPKLGVQHYPMNQFITLVERCAKDSVIKTIFGNEHTSWNNHSKVLVKSKVRWLQISHDQNLMNEFKGSLVYPKLLKGFNIIPIKFGFSYSIWVSIQRFYQKLFH